jgi:ubiquinone/menaquinone biosynthesis C-methylase UbiE
MDSVFEQESTVEKWDTDYYHPIALWLYDQAILDMLRLMDVCDNANIMDAGCGPGNHSIRIAKTGNKVYAIDISDSMLHHARQRVEKACVLDSVEFNKQDLTQLDCQDASFNYVFSWGVIIHIPEPENALNELARIIKPGGKLSLYLTNRAALDHKIKLFARYILRKPPTNTQKFPLGDRTWYEDDYGKLCVWLFDADAIIEYMRNKGFRLLARRIGEFSELQRHFGGLFRRSLLHANNLAYKLHLPPNLATGNLFVFEKCIE